MNRFCHLSAKTQEKRVRIYQNPRSKLFLTSAKPLESGQRIFDNISDLQVGGRSRRRRRLAYSVEWSKEGNTDMNFLF